jgi:hypothetical protein
VGNRNEVKRLILETAHALKAKERPDSMCVGNTLPTSQIREAREGGERQECEKREIMVPSLVCPFRSGIRNRAKSLSPSEVHGLMGLGIYYIITACQGLPILSDSQYYRVVTVFPSYR